MRNASGTVFHDALAGEGARGEVGGGDRGGDHAERQPTPRCARTSGPVVQVRVIRRVGGEDAIARADERARASARMPRQRYEPTKQLRRPFRGRLTKRRDPNPKRKRSTKAVHERTSTRRPEYARGTRVVTHHTYTSYPIIATIIPRITSRDVVSEKSYAETRSALTFFFKGELKIKTKHAHILALVPVDSPTTSYPPWKACATRPPW